jgi:hypothetical protein
MHQCLEARRIEAKPEEEENCSKKSQNAPHEQLNIWTLTII